MPTSCFGRSGHTAAHVSACRLSSKVGLTGPPAGSASAEPPGQVKPLCTPCSSLQRGCPRRTPCFGQRFKDLVFRAQLSSLHKRVASPLPLMTWVEPSPEQLGNRRERARTCTTTANRTGCHKALTNDQFLKNVRIMWVVMTSTCLYSVTGI